MSHPHPYMKWAGGKRRQAAEILGAFTGTPSAWIVPFIGAGGVTFSMEKLPERAILNDLNKHLMLVHRWVQFGVLELIDKLRTLPVQDGAWQPRYRELRDRFNHLVKSGGPDASLEKAALFMWLNKACFNGLYRVNRRGEFNVPAGSYRDLNLFDEYNLLRAAEHLEGTSLFSCDVIDLFGERIGDVDGAWIYFDPPYWPRSQSANFTGYTAGGYTSDDQRALAACARDVVRRGAQVVLSNHDLPQVRALYEGFELRTIQAARSISRKGSGRGPVGEMMIIGRPGMTFGDVPV